jgi:hypothetical protein
MAVPLIVGPMVRRKIACRVLSLLVSKVGGKEIRGRKDILRNPWRPEDVIVQSPLTHFRFDGVDILDRL